MRLIRWAGPFRTAVLLALTSGLGTLAYAAPPAACGSLTAGFTVVNVPNQPGGSNYNANPPQTTLKMGIWYPSYAAASAYGYDDQISGQVALNATIANCGSAVLFPLVIFSHGWSGCGTQSVFLTEELARRGYIVAAPDHADHGCRVDGGAKQSYQDVETTFPLKEFGDPSVWTAQSGNYRNIDIKTVTDWLLATSPWKDSINVNEIAMSGHSFGGYTAFAKIGGWPSWLDTRFKAGIMYSPFIQAFEAQKPSTVPLVKVPQMFQGGTTDIGITPWVKGPQPCPKARIPARGSASPATAPECAPEPGAFQQAQFPKYFAELGTGSSSGSGSLLGGGRLGGGRLGGGRLGGSGSTGSNSAALDASHFAFSDKICGGTSTTPATVSVCLQTVPNAALIVNYSQFFLDYYLRGQTDPSLLSTGPGWDTYWRTGGVPDGSYLPGIAAARLGLASLKGDNLAPQTASAPTSSSLPTQIDAVTVTLTPQETRSSSSGGGGGGILGGLRGGRFGGGGSTPTTYQAFVFAISPREIDFVVPSEVPSNAYYVATASLNGAEIAAGPLSITDVSPSFLTIGAGFAMGTATTGSTTTPLYNASTSAPNPVTVTPGSTTLAIQATGLHFATNITATIGGTSIPVTIAPSSTMGIGTVTLGPLPAIKGQENIVLSVGPLQSNPVAVVLQ